MPSDTYTAALRELNEAAYKALRVSTKDIRADRAELFRIAYATDRLVDQAAIADAGRV